MRQPFLRYITGDAGHVKRLYDFVKIAQEFPDRAALQREILSERKSDSEKKGRFTGIKSPRSFEPHQALARELDILEQGERWRITSSVGMPFLRLWEKEGMIPPKFLLLSQLLRYDRAMSIPFIKRYLIDGKTNAPKIISDIWVQMWKLFPIEMERAEPPLPRSLKRENGELKRTCNHHASFRLRFLTNDEGLSLDKEQLERMTDQFKNYNNPKFPSDHYAKIGFIFSGKECKVSETMSFKKEIVRSFGIFQSSGYSSVAAVFNYINNLILPSMSLDWNEFIQFMRNDGSFSLSPSSRSDDLLFTVKERR